MTRCFCIVRSAKMVYLEHLIEYQISNNFQCLVLYFGENALFDFKLNEFFGFYSWKSYSFWDSVLWVRRRREKKNVLEVIPERLATL